MNRRLFYFIKTYGCQMNEYDTEKIALQLEMFNYVATQNIQEADFIVLNTCCVRESAEKKIYGKIGEIKNYKKNKPSLKLVITGCMAQKEEERILKKYPYIDLVLGTAQIWQLKNVLKNWHLNSSCFLKKRMKERVITDLNQETMAIKETISLKETRLLAFVAITKGCNNFCSYCIVPYVRGREKSRKEEDILKEIKELSEQGVKEVTLLGQNVNSYGKDLSSLNNFAGLLKSVSQIEGIERIRYMTSHPRDMGKDVIEEISVNPKICEHFHLPLQSGSDAILKLMNRGYDKFYYASLIDNIRKSVEGASFTTDLIVGFPGETEEMFEETLDFVKKMHFDSAYIFLYSKRSGTPAAEMEDQILQSEKKMRFQRLTKLQNAISLSINEAYVGKTVEVLCEGKSKNDENFFMGRTSANKIVMFEVEKKQSTNDYVGQLLQIKIEKAQTWVLFGNLV